MCILTYRSPYRVAEKKGRGRRAGKASSRGAPREMWGVWTEWTLVWALGIQEASSSPLRPPSRLSSSPYL